MDIIVATNNQGKVKEIKNILSPHNVMSQMEIGVDIDVEETGDTFVENAFLKARAIKPYTQCAIIADDSGLCVDALGGAPGVYSARYAGEEHNYPKNNEKLLENLAGVPDEKRTARFKTVIAVCFPDGTELTCEGCVEGKIATELRGERGFGYDPLFYSFELGKVFAEGSLEEKNSVGHRGRALRKMLEILKENQHLLK